jgi:hypothetical protein
VGSGVLSEATSNHHQPDHLPKKSWSVLAKANPNMGVSVDADFLRARQHEAMQSAIKQAVFRTKHLNEWVGAKNAWMNMLKWAQCPTAQTTCGARGAALLFTPSLSNDLLSKNVSAQDFQLIWND